MGIELYAIKRGGAITYHGPGQIVGYPVLDFENFKRDIRWYMTSMAEVIIRTLADYGISGHYDAEFPGVWIDKGPGNAKDKICAIGVHLSRWVSNHGFAFNVQNTMEYYNYFIPCGIQETGRGVTSLQAELGREVDLREVKERITLYFSELFATELF